jgi:chromosomal replication initiator protein
MDDRERDVVSAFRAKLAQRIGADQAVWFDSVDFVPSNGVLTVLSTDKFMHDWLKSHFHQDLEAVCADLFGQATMIRFQKPSSENAARGNTVRACATTAVQNEAASTVAPMLKPASVPQINPLAPSAVQVRRGHLLTDFVVGDSNRLAFSAAQSAVSQAGRMSPLLVHGPTGVGKTHLLDGVCLAHRESGGKALYLSAEQFTYDFVEAVKRGGFPIFRRKYRDLTLLALDDLPFLSRKKATIAELVYTIDSISHRGGQIVLASDVELPRLKDLGPELVSRLSGGVVCSLTTPEFSTRLEIVRLLARKLEVDLDEDVAQYVAGHFVGNARALAGAVKRLAAMSEATQEPIHRDLAERALEDLMTVATRPIKLEDIQHVVCDEFGLEPASLQSARRDMAVNHARMLAMWLARNHTRTALSEIGRFFGGRSHSAVVAAQKRVTSMLSRGDDVQLHGRPRSLDSSIRRLQTRLKLA